MVTRKEWTRDSIIESLLAVSASGESIAPRALCRSHHGLYHAALKLFGSYRDALTAAGIDPAAVMTFPTKREWSREAIIEAIRETHAAGQRATTKVLMRRYAGGIYEATIREFGSWEKALAAAGVPVTWSFVRWTHELILSTLAQLSDQGISLSSVNLSRNQGHSALVMAAMKLYGGYRIALAAVQAVPAWQSGKRLPAGFWADQRNVRAVFRYVLGQQGISLEEAPRVCRRRWFEQHRLGGMLRHHYRNSPACFFIALYPEVAKLANMAELPRAKDLQARVLAEAGFAEATTKDPYRFSARVRGLDWVKR